MESYFKSSTIIQVVELFARFRIYKNKNSISIDKSYLDRYLQSLFSQKNRLNFLDYFQFQIKDFNHKSQADLAAYIEESKAIIELISAEINQKQKYDLFTAILEYVLYIENHYSNQNIQPILREQLDLLIKGFQLNRNALIDIEAFVQGNLSAIKNKEAVIVIGDFRSLKPKSFKTMDREFLEGYIHAYFLEENESFYIKYQGSSILELNSQMVIPDRIYQLNIGGLIEGEDIQPVYYNSLNTIMMQHQLLSLNLYVHKLSKTFPITGMGVKELSFQVPSGQLIAVVGGSGTGKTTLMSMLSGTLKADSGSVYINGHSLFDDYEVLKNYIGFVPQEDLLIEELTVYQNIMYGTLLSRDDLSEREQKVLVIEVLKELGLYQVKGLKIGSPTDKMISGGQRKRLNIALEMIRKPDIIYVDEPTSGLSSSDAFLVIKHLKEFTLNGKIVMINIHQPSSDIFLLFDQLLVMDKMGYAAYYGNPFSAAPHFKKHLEFEDSAVEDNMRYGQCNPERIIDLLEYKKSDSNGNLTNERVFLSEDWHNKFLNSISMEEFGSNNVLELAAKVNKIPNVFRQFLFFLERNILTRYADKAYALVAILGPAILSFAISFFLKSTDVITHDYSFAQNDNIPVYLFISVLISIFLGLIISSGEIIKDRRILKRESFLNLSPRAYLGSKLVFLSIVNAYQVATFILIGNTILNIKGMFFYFFIILWVTSIASSSLGLLLSTKLESIISIYIVIPFIIIPFIIMSGVILDFDKMHHTLTSKEFVPISADLTLSRWAYEAIVDAQISLNDYNKGLQPYYIEQSKYAYYIRYILPKLNSSIDMLIEESADTPADIKNIELLLQQFKTNFPKMGQSIEQCQVKATNINSLRSLTRKIKKWLTLNYKSVTNNINNIKSNSTLNEADFVNIKLSDFVMKRNLSRKFIVADNQVIRKYQPAYNINANTFGRSHYYAPYKMIGSLKIKTWIFNTVILLLWGIILNVISYRTLIKIKY